MSWYQLRPTFELPILVSRDDAIRRLRSQYIQMNQRNLFVMNDEYGEIHVPAEEHRFWSPHLSFYVSDLQDRCKIYGRFAPRFHIWSFVWAMYLGMSFTAFFSLIFACAQWMMGTTLWGAWVFVASILAIAMLTITAQIGQQLSSDQMASLRETLTEILQQAGVIDEDGD